MIVFIIKVRANNYNLKLLIPTFIPIRKNKTPEMLTYWGSTPYFSGLVGNQTGETQTRNPFITNILHSRIIFLIPTIGIKVIPCVGIKDLTKPMN